MKIAGYFVFEMLLEVLETTVPDSTNKIIIKKIL